jgi:hypothetical protein
LTNSTTYYWKVVAKKDCGTSTSGPIWSFSTNSIPSPTLVSILVTPANASIVVGTTQQFTATGSYSDNTTKNITSSVTWSSSNTGVATISNTGLATSIAAGSTTIKAALASISGSTTLTVTASITWAISTVESYGNPGSAYNQGYTSIAVDNSDNPHISYLYYIDGFTTQVKYAKWDGTEWVFTTVDLQATGMGSLKLDGNGYPHIAYTGDFTPTAHWPNLRYAYWDGTSWFVHIVDVCTLDVGGYSIIGETSLALDPSGYAHIAYFAYQPGGVNGTLKYARGTGSSWFIQTVDSVGSANAWGSSIALGANGYPHISYYDNAHQMLKYARWTGSSWVIQTVDNNGVYPSIAIDSNGYPHISYNGTAGSGETLKYARWTGSSWNIQIIDDRCDYRTAITLDANNNPHIVYMDNSMNYVYWTGTQWLFKNVEGNVNADYPSIALSPVTGRPHVSYYNMVTDDLQYAVMH